MTFTSRPTSGRHRLGALFTFALAVLLYISSKSPYQPHEGSRLDVFRNVSQQYDTGVDEKSAITLLDLGCINPGFNTSIYQVDDTHGVLSTQPKYFKRDEDDDERKEAYDKALCSGIQMLSKVNQDSHQGRSQFSQPEELEENGWTYSEPESSLPQDLAVVCPGLGISTNEQDNIYTSIKQDEAFSNRFAARNAPTDAVYDNIINARGHTIFAIYNYGPVNAFAAHPPAYAEQHVPDLNRWSDVMWVVWETHAGNQASQLEYIFRHTIDTVETVNVIEHIVALSGGGALGGYPGITRSLNTDDGLALLGTPNAKGPAWMLYDHRDKIQKRIDWIRVWTYKRQGEAEYDMLIKLKDP